MRFRIVAAALLFMVMAFGLAGCKGQYSFSFLIEQDTENAQGAWILEQGAAGWSIVANGLNMQDVNAACPKRFSGDFTMTFRFRVKTNNDHKYTFGFALSDYTFYSSPQNSIEIEFFGIGTSSYTYSITEKSYGSIPVQHTSPLSPPEFFNDGGLNTFKIVKTGDILRLYEGNGTEEYLWDEFDMNVYDSRWFGPNAFAYIGPATPDSAWGFTLESIVVEYDGIVSEFQASV